MLKLPGKKISCDLRLMIQFVPRSKPKPSPFKKTSQLMLYCEIIAVCSDIHAKQRNTPCGREGRPFLRQNLAVGRETTGLQTIN
jgi:hypothetical protein